MQVGQNRGDCLRECRYIKKGTMNVRENQQNRSAEKTVRDIRRATRRQYSVEEKIRIVLEGLRGEESIAELCRREGINTNIYCLRSKEFLEAGKKRLAGDTTPEATCVMSLKIFVPRPGCSKKPWLSY